MKGSFSLVLHSHIPYCRKSGVWPAGEEWLFEAMLETYLPLLQAMNGWMRDRIKARITVGVVPILAEQLADDYLKARFDEYIDDKIKRARQDEKRFSNNPAMARAARYWTQRFESAANAWNSDFGRDINGAFRRFQDAEICELITSSATHCFLPLLDRDAAIRAHVRVGVDTYKKHFGRNPRGFWLPECAYRPAEWSKVEKRERAALDTWLAGEGIEYFFVEGVGITRARFVEKRFTEETPNTLRGYRLRSGVAVFGRNDATGRQVWSPAGGYPGEYAYLEFHRKDPESGLRYWRVTGAEEKAIYDPDVAHERIESHARHFVSLIKHEFEEAQKTGITEPIIVSPYDAELFGHWWHEGVEWIDHVFRLLSSDDEVQAESPGDYHARCRENLSTIEMTPSTWGLNSDFTVWKNPQHGWVWPLINDCSIKAEKIFNGLGDNDPRLEGRGGRIIRQLGRELLLMQGSDWPFLLFTGQAKDYANQRFHHHHQRLLKLLWAAENLGDSSRITEKELSDFEEVDNPWHDLDWRVFL